MTVEFERILNGTNLNSLSDDELREYRAALVMKVDEVNCVIRNRKILRMRKNQTQPPNDKKAK